MMICFSGGVAPFILNVKFDGSFFSPRRFHLVCGWVGPIADRVIPDHKKNRII